MRTRIGILMAVIAAAGCKVAPTRTPPAPPPAIADRSASGERRVMFDALGRMATEDAAAARH